MRIAIDARMSFFNVGNQRRFPLYKMGLPIRFLHPGKTRKVRVCSLNETDEYVRSADRYANICLSNMRLSCTWMPRSFFSARPGSTAYTTGICFETAKNTKAFDIHWILAFPMKL